jgi:hypothetical protein
MRQLTALAQPAWRLSRPRHANCPIYVVSRPAPKQLFDRYARAREHQFAYWADEIKSISDLTRSDMGAVQKARLQIDTRKWLLAKLLPKVYGDRIETTGPPVLHLHQHNGPQAFAGKSDAELAALYRERVTLIGRSEPAIESIIDVDPAAADAE